MLSPRQTLEVVAIGAHDSVCMLVYKVSFKSSMRCEYHGEYDIALGSADVAFSVPLYGGQREASRGDEWLYNVPKRLVYRHQL